MANEMVKIKVPRPRNDASGVEAEWMWADVAGKNCFLLRKVPVFAFGMSYGDEETQQPLMVYLCLPMLPSIMTTL